MHTLVDGSECARIQPLMHIARVISFVMGKDYIRKIVFYQFFCEMHTNYRYPHIKISVELMHVFQDGNTTKTSLVSLVQVLHPMVTKMPFSV